MNYMEQVAQMLGVDMEERFEIEDFEECDFCISNNGLESSRLDLYCPAIFTDLIAGRYEVTKIPQHTGLEDVEEGTTTLYTLFGPGSGFSLCYKKYITEPLFSDRMICNNWERYIRIKLRLAKAASELNTEPIDWNDENKAKWYISCDPNNNDLIFNNRIYKGPGDDIYFNKAGAAKKAIEIVGKDDLIWMLRDFQAFIGYSREVAADE